MPPPTAILLNSKSGLDDKQPLRQRLADLWAAEGREARIWLTEEGQGADDLARRAVAEGCDPLVAGGGDGTINAVAAVAIEAERTLGVLPLGTFNHFAKDLKIPLDLEGAARVCLDGHTARVDVGEVDGRIFLNNSSLGLYPSIVRHREKRQAERGWGKKAAFLWATAAMLRRYPFLDVELEVEERKLFRRTPFVFIGNNEYEMESLRAGARPALDRGELSLHVAHRTGRLGLLRLAFRGLFGGLRRQHDFDALCTREIRVATRHDYLRVALDGEVTLMRTPLHYRIRPGVLRVLVPEPAEPAEETEAAGTAVSAGAPPAARSESA
jgi:diacylglycerol kinase family enzyme